MINSLESGFDSHVSFNVRSGPAPQGVQKKEDYEEKMSTSCSKVSTNLFLIGCCFDFKM